MAEEQVANGAQDGALKTGGKEKRFLLRLVDCHRRLHDHGYVLHGLRELHVAFRRKSWAIWA